MDFRLFFSVLRRFKFIVGLGFILACALAFLSYVKVGPHGLEYRQDVTWSSTTRVLVTNPAGSQDPVVLAQLYASFATSDEVAKAAIRRHGIPGALQAESGYLNRTSTALPTVSLTAVSTTPARSALLANDAIEALRSFVDKQQEAAGVAPAHRVQMETLNLAIPFRAQVFLPRSKTPPIIVFVLVLAVTIGLAFLLENLRPRVREAPLEVETTTAYIDARRARDQA
jgi:capsular polysaccharide biosynthesis protein